MKLKIILWITVIPLALISCTENKALKIENLKKGQLTRKYELIESSKKKFKLDSLTSPMVQCSQVYMDSNGNRNFTFLNKNNKIIYVYNYHNSALVKKIPVNTTDIGNAQGYFIQSEDSIYVYDKSFMSLSLMNRKGNVLKKLSLIDNKNLKKSPWYFNYPQYDPQTATSFIKTPTELLFIGQYMESLPDSLVDKFKFIAHINLKTDKITYTNLYPKTLYGSNYNWDGQLYTQVYADLNPFTNQLAIGFPISHEVYLAEASGNYKSVYAGSNTGTTISSISKKPGKASNSELRSNFIKNDVYAALKYDKYRNVYYRLVRKAVATPKENQQIQEKPIVVIIMDENFNYLGETEIGLWRNWHIENTFVTEEGLNIEHIDKEHNEDYLTLKIFSLKQI